MTYMFVSMCHGMNKPNCVGWGQKSFEVLVLSMELCLFVVWPFFVGCYTRRNSNWFLTISFDFRNGAKKKIEIRFLESIFFVLMFRTKDNESSFWGKNAFSRQTGSTFNSSKMAQLQKRCIKWINSNTHFMINSTHCDIIKKSTLSAKKTWQSLNITLFFLFFDKTLRK